MIALIYSVKDELQNKFHNPIFIPDGERTEEQATRLFKTQLNNTAIWKENPSDFSLWILGAIDDSTGVITSGIEKITDGRSVLNVGSET